MESFFLTPPSFAYICLFRIFCSFVAGFVLGLERRYRQQTVGMRTLILICVSSCLLMLTSICVANYSGGKQGDPARIAAQVVSGIGFLGGGAILRQGVNIKGLTSSAIIWTTAALGLCIGAGLCILGFFTLALCIVALIWLNKVEAKYFVAEKSKMIKLCLLGSVADFDALKQVIHCCGFVIADFGFEKDIENNTITIFYTVKELHSTSITILMQKLEKVCNIKTFAYGE